MATLEEFEAAVKNHDITFAYSDDFRWYERGRLSLANIRRMAKELPVEDVKRIWNANIDRQLAAAVRESFYWSE